MGQTYRKIVFESFPHIVISRRELYDLETKVEDRSFNREKGITD